MIAHVLFVAGREIRTAQIAHMPEGVVAGIQLFHLLLCEVADGEVGSGNAPAGERRGFAGQHFRQGRFAGAVRTQESDPIEWTQGNVDPADDAASGIAASRTLDGQ
jgi:hypothetical protein